MLSPLLIFGRAFSMGMDIDQPFNFDVGDEEVNAMDIDHLGPPSDDFVMGADGVRRRKKRVSLRSSCSPSA